tara:strand:+ start:521 stop:1771 length:1251 start_codon:yes stop_codon:yes gene_type:complete
MFFLYQVIIFLILILSPFIIVVRILKNKEDKTRFIEKFSIPSKKRLNGKLIWFHGASVGEILSIVPIIKNYEKKRNINQILVTTSTLSSSKVLKKFKFKKTIHQFYPIDNFYLTYRFLKFWRPNISVFVDSEIWPSMFRNLKKKKIPLILLNARLTKKTFKRWMRFKNFSTKVFKNITATYPQNLETKGYLKKLKLNEIKYLGNLKFAENHEENLDKIDDKLKKELIKKKIWVASSTHQGEELFCAKAHIELKKKVKNLITIIIPRHIHRSRKIISEIENLNLKVSCHSFKPKSLKNTDIYIVDTFGETKKFHKISCSVFLGGSIIYRGGQNPLEAARFGAKILHGPNIGNFKDVYKLLKSFRISQKVNTPKKLALSIAFKKNKNIGNRVKNIGGNILKKTIREIDKFIINEPKKT